jgi:hypothetical protein
VYIRVRWPISQSQGTAAVFDSVGRWLAARSFRDHTYVQSPRAKAVVKSLDRRFGFGQHDLHSPTPADSSRHFDCSSPRSFFYFVSRRPTSRRVRPSVPSPLYRLDTIDLYAKYVTVSSRNANMQLRADQQTHT